MSENQVKPTYYEIKMIEEVFDKKTGEKTEYWMKVGALFPFKEKDGFSIDLKAYPSDGQRLVALPPKVKTEEQEAE